MYALSMRALRDYINAEHHGSVTACASVLGVSRHTVYSWLIGRRMPNRRHAVILHIKTHIPFEVLLEGGNGMAKAKTAKKVTKKT